MVEPIHLRALADRVGILPDYFDITGTLQVTKDDTRVALLDAMGYDASSEALAAQTLRRLDRLVRERLLPPVRVLVRDAENAPTAPLAIPGEDDSACEWRLELREEAGAVHVAEGFSEPHGWDHALHVKLPVNPPVGYHTLRVAVESAGRTYKGEQSLIVSPGRCAELAEMLGEQRAFGVWTNLYTARSGHNWGVGDLTDLADLAGGLAPCGAVFVGTNPMHALFNRDGRISPYCPVSRLFRNLIYLDIEATPEFPQCHKAQSLFNSATFQEELAEVRSSRFVAYERAAALKLEILRRLHETFAAEHADGNNERGRAYADYVAAQGNALIDFATYSALHEWLKTNVQDRKGWRNWPAAYRDPDSHEVEAFRAAHRSKIDFQCYVQFELDRQLGKTADAAKESGMHLGLYPDLAIGSAADGSDAWTYQDLFVDGVEVGAPPDPFSDTGQTWGFPPVNPHRLEARRFDYWIGLLRASLAHAGMLRIDHVMGLFRQFWVPDGLEATEGAYVRYPAEALLGILAIESQRHGAVIVGEDLGTVPPEVPEALARWGILSSQVLYFEREGDGTFRPSGSYAKRALVTATTHDHVPLAGFWTGRDLDIRSELGLIATKQEQDEARRQREDALAALLRALMAEGISLDAAIASPEDFCATVHAFLARTPSSLVGLSLDDLAGEVDPINLPGVTQDHYRNWSRRMRRSVEEILGDPGVRRVLAETRAGRSGSLPS